MIMPTNNSAVDDLEDAVALLREAVVVSDHYHRRALITH